MRFQVLGSGSGGNSALVRAGELHLIVDAGLSIRSLTERLEAARVPLLRLDHIALTHGHLDHARSAGVLAKRARARVHCSDGLLRNRSLRKAPVASHLSPSKPNELEDAWKRDLLRLTAVPIPHDAQPTYALRMEHEDRTAVVITDMGKPDPQAARALADPHLLALEFNHDADMLRSGPYPDPLKKRIRGPGGHLSNEEAGTMLRLLAGPKTHTLVLLHLSQTNNTPELATTAARNVLQELGREDVKVVVAEQDRIGENLKV